MGKHFLYPFASAGDIELVPETAQPDDSISYESGYTLAYEGDLDLDPLARDIERVKLNKILLDITKNLQDWQHNTYPDFITAAENGGVAFTYNKGDVVTYAGTKRISLVDANLALPSDVVNWADLFPLPVEVGGTGSVSIGDFLVSSDILTGTESDERYLNAANNLSDLTSVATALINLGLSIGDQPTDIPTITIGDQRWLNTTNNLSDVSSIQTSRDNLGLGSIATEDSSVFTNGLLPLATLAAWQSALGITGGGGGGDPLKTGAIVPATDTPANMIAAGYLPLNGAELSRTTYSALFAALGTYAGDGDGSTTFNVPVSSTTFPIVTPGIADEFTGLFNITEPVAFITNNLAYDETNQHYYISERIVSSKPNIYVYDNAGTLIKTITSTDNGAIAIVGSLEFDNDTGILYVGASSPNTSSPGLYKLSPGGTVLETLYSTLIELGSINPPYDISANPVNNELIFCNAINVYKFDLTLLTYSEIATYPGSAAQHVAWNYVTGEIWAIDESIDNGYYSNDNGATWALNLGDPIGVNQTGISVDVDTGFFYIGGSNQLYLSTPGSGSVIGATAYTNTIVGPFVARGITYDSVNKRAIVYNTTDNGFYYANVGGTTSQLPYYIKA